MERLEKLVNLLEKKYGNTNITESNKVEIRKIISEEIARVTESLEEVDDSQTSMTYASLERAMKYSKGIYKKMKEQNIEDVDGWVFAKITLADDYLKSVYSYLDGNDGLKEDEQLDQAFNDAKPVDEKVDKDDLKNAKFRLKNVYKYLDIEYKTTRRGEKYVQINYIPVTKPQSQNPEFVNVRYEDETDLQNIGKALKLKLKESVTEEAKRDYKKEYAKYGKSEKAKKYRAELNKYNRDKGTYGNGDGKDASHKGGKIVGFESESKNRGRAEKSRLKKSK